MKLPNGKNAIVQREKLTHYLLSLTHEKGRSKAKFFRMIGFNGTNINEFELALLKICKLNKVIKVDKTKQQLVIKYTIDGVIDAPLGKKYKVRTIWAIDADSKIPHLVTAWRGV